MSALIPGGLSTRLGDCCRLSLCGNLSTPPRRGLPGLAWLQLSPGRQTPLRARRGIFFVLERLLQQLPEQFSRDYYDTKK